MTFDKHLKDAVAAALFANGAGGVSAENIRQRLPEALRTQLRDEVTVTHVTSLQMQVRVPTNSHGVHYYLLRVSEQI